MLLQFPLFWYSAPALLKEWIDLTFEQGFAYGHGGNRLKGKRLMLALTTGGPEEAYGPQGYQHFDLRTFLTPFEPTARLCQMSFLPPYVLFGALTAEPAPHAKGFARLLEALRDDRFDGMRAASRPVLTHDTLPSWDSDENELAGQLVEAGLPRKCSYSSHLLRSAKLIELRSPGS